MDFDFPKVELHLHVDGAIRHQTVLELAQAKNIELKEAGDNSTPATDEAQVRRLLVPKPPYNLDRMLQKFYMFMPCLVGDVEAIERVAYELCEDQAKQGVAYFEGRFSPHFLSTTNNSSTMQWKRNHDHKATPQCCTEAVLRGLSRGSRDFGVAAGAILCCIRAHPHWHDDVLKLAAKFKDDGVVGIDLAGCAHAGADEHVDEHVVAVFHEAARLGLHRTVHAGESGQAAHVKQAYEELKAERIGHGYRALADADVYEWSKKVNLHYETCPTSSVLTGAVQLGSQDDWTAHPIRKFADDGVNFGVSTDDPTVFGCMITDELSALHERMRLTKRQLWQCQLNAARAAFSDERHKVLLVKRILDAEPAEDMLTA